MDGTPLLSLIGTEKLSQEEWAALKERVVKGGANIIKLRGRSSFQSPSYVAVEMIAAAMGGEPFTLPSGCYVFHADYGKVMMAMETRIDKDGVHCLETKGTDEEMSALKQSAEHYDDRSGGRNGYNPLCCRLGYAQSESLNRTLTAQ